MTILGKVIGLVAAGLTVMILYVSVSASGALSGATADPAPATSPLGFAVYIGLLLTAVCGGLILILATSGGGQDE